MLDLILQGIAVCFEPWNLLALLLSVALGIVIGALPGFGAATGLIMVLPLTYSMEPATAFLALAGVYVGAEYGGSISSILLNTPGTGGAVVTCFDGFPMANKGQARKALFISNIASFSGGITSGLVMLFCMPILGGVVLHFGAGEILALAVIGLLLVGSISQQDTLKGITSAAIGVLITCIGADPFMGNLRFDFDIDILIGGIPFVPVMLGMFSVPHLMSLVLNGGTGDASAVSLGALTMRENTSLFFSVFRNMFGRMKLLLVRSGLFGVLIGMVPGVGAAVSTMVAYTAAKRASKTPEEFGHGSPEGVAAPEASNNGLVGGSLIPVLALGIPGSPAAAIFMGAIFLHGMTPGPNFLVNQADLVYILIMGVLLAAVVQLLLGMFTIGSFANILRVPPEKLFPSILVICTLGAYVVRGLSFDMFLFAGFGLAAYFLLKIGFNSGAFILGMILGNITERSLLEALALASAQGGLIPYFAGRIVALGIIACMLIYVAWRVWTGLRGKKLEAKEQSKETGRWSGMRGADAAYGALLALICTGLLLTTRDLGRSAALFPRLVLGFLIVLSTAMALKAVFFGRAYAGRNGNPFQGVPFFKILTLASIWGAYLLIIDHAGFYTASFGLVLSLGLVLSSWRNLGLSVRSIGLNTLFALLFTAGAYVVFNRLFLIVTPAGALI